MVQIMKIVTATEIKVHLGEYMDESKVQPVFIEKYGRPTSVLISQERYRQLLACEERLLDLQKSISCSDNIVL